MSQSGRLELLHASYVPEMLGYSEENTACFVFTSVKQAFKTNVAQIWEIYKQQTFFFHNSGDKHAQSSHQVIWYMTMASFV